jgi:hypothetical protein
MERRDNDSVLFNIDAMLECIRVPDLSYAVIWRHLAAALEYDSDADTVVFQKMKG